MEKQSNSAGHVEKVHVHVHVQVQPPLFAILGEAFKTSTRNGRVLLFITFIIFPTYAVMGLADRFVLQPRMDDFDANFKLLPKNPSFLVANTESYQAVIEDTRFFLTYKFVVLSFLCLVLTFSGAATVHSTFEAYTAKVLSLEETLLGTEGRWKRALKTSVWMIVISLASAGLLNPVFGVIRVTIGDTVLGSLNWEQVLFGVFAVYLSCLWMLGLVVSVLEENLSGLKAITEANELIKGKKLRGSALMMIMILASVAISKAFDFFETTTTTQNTKLARVVGSAAISISRSLAYDALTLFALVVYTVFYHECRESQAVEEDAALYSPISAACDIHVSVIIEQSLPDHSTDSKPHKNLQLLHQLC